MGRWSNRIKKRESLWPIGLSFKKNRSVFSVDVYTAELLKSLLKLSSTCAMEVMKDLQHNIVLFSSLNVATSRMNGSVYP